MTQLDQLIDAASNESTAVEGAVRKLLVLARRFGASEAQDWAELELNGYPDEELGILELPPYRLVPKVNVIGQWKAGAAPSALQLLSHEATSGAIDGPVSSLGAPAEDAFYGFTFGFKDPIGRLEGLIGSPAIYEHWSPQSVMRWNDLLAERKVFALDDWHLVSAYRTASGTVVSEVIRESRKTVLDFAVGLEAIAPRSGKAGRSASKREPATAPVMNFHNTIHGNVGALAQGTIGEQAVVIAGDMSGLLKAASDIGFSDQQGIADLVKAVTAPEEKRASRVRSFLNRVKSGTYALALGVSAEVLASRLEPLIQQYHGW